jgi:ABC-2 type transport system ATP-binding protein
VGNGAPPARDGVTIILTTHYIEEAEEMADRIGVINQGRDHPGGGQAHADAQARQEAADGWSCSLRSMPYPERLPGFGLELADGGATLTYSLRHPGERTGITALFKDLREAGLRFRDLETRQSSLEEIFVNLVRRRA